MSEDEMELSDFDRLPIEMQRKLFSYLPFDDKISARRVSTLWCDLVDENLSFFVTLDDDSLEFVENLGRPIDQLTVVNLSKKKISFKDSIRAHMGTLVRHLTLGQWQCVKGKSCSISQDNVVALLTALMDEIQSLTLFLSHLCMKDVSLFSLISFQQVTKLDIIVRRVDEMDIFFGLLKLNLKVLAWLRMDWDKIYLNSVDKMLPLYREIYNFVATHHDTLKSLFLILPFHWIDRRETIRRRARRRSSDDDGQVKIMPPDDPNYMILLANRLKNVQLTEFLLKGLPVEGSDTFSLGISLLDGQKCLKTVRLHDLKVGYYPRLETLFQNCGPTLVHICIEGSSMGAHSYGPFSCKLLRFCTSLHTLIINNSQITKLTQITYLPHSLRILSLKMPIDGTVVYPWISQNLVCLQELTIRPTLWDTSAVLDLVSFKNFLGLPSLVKLNLSDGLFESHEILQFVDGTEGLNAVSASYLWPDLVNVYILIDRNVYKHLY